MTQPTLVDNITPQPVPEFLPPHIRDACADKRVTFKVHKGLRECMQVPENLTVSEHAEKYRRVTAIDAYPGRWRNDLVPHARHIMDLISQPHVKEVWLCMVERASKTNILLNTALWQIDRGVDSGNIFWLMPNEGEAKKALGERIIPVFKASPRIARLLSRYADDTTRTMVRFKHGPRLFPAWAQSAASVSSFFGRLNIADEIDKAETKGVGSEADIISLFEKRGRDREDSKFLYASTPAGRFIYKGTMRCQHVWGFFSKCPHCGDLIMMDADHFDIPEGALVEDLKAGVHKIHYSCNANGCLWNEEDRKYAYLNGRWQLVKGEGVDRAVSVGVHLPAFPLPNIKMSEIAAAIRRAEGGDIEAKKNLEHSFKAIDYEPETVTREYESILALCDDRPRDLVPADTACLLMQVDTHMKGFYYEIAAVEYGERPSGRLVREGYVLGFDDLVQIAEMSFYDAGKTEYCVRSAVIDSGGTRQAGKDHSRTEEVYAFCKKHPLFKPIKGAHQQSSPWRVSNRDFWPGTNKQIPGGLQLYTILVDYYKDALAGRLQISPDDPGAWLLYSGFTEEEAQRPFEMRPKNRLVEYAKHFCAEYRDERGHWKHDDKKGRNDYWDVGVYRLFHIDMLRIGDWKRPDEVKTRNLPPGASRSRPLPPGAVRR